MNLLKVFKNEGTLENRDVSEVMSAISMLNALLVRIDASLSMNDQRMADLEEGQQQIKLIQEDTNKKVIELSTFDFIGKAAKISESAVETVSKYTVAQVRHEFSRILYGWEGSKAWTKGNLAFYQKWDAYYASEIADGKIPSSKNLKGCYYEGNDKDEVKGANNKTKINDLLNKGLKDRVLIILHEMSKKR